MAGVREGDLLISVNGKKTTRLGIDSDVSTKSEKKKSKRKHKHKHGDKAEAEERRLRKQYSVVWERGSLGISFRAYNSKVNVPCVDFISASRGLGRGMDRVCVNDVLIAINGEKTKALGVEKVLRWLHVVEKPVVLRFHASSNRILNPAGGLLPQLADEDVEASERPRRPTMPLPLPQPEYEPPPRPPRRNNSVDQPMPQQRMERGYSDDREYELQPAVAPRRYSRDSATYFEKQPIEEYDSSHDEDGVAGDFRREPKDADAHRRLQQSEDRISQPQLQLPPSRTRTSSASRDDIRRQQLSENKPAPPPPPTDAAARPRLASRDSQVSNSSQLSFDEATGVVARAAGKPKEECEFGGVPLLDIKEGTVQAKLMYIYAKACLAKEGSSDDEPASKDPQPSLLWQSTRSQDAFELFVFRKDAEGYFYPATPPPVVTLPLSSAGPSSSVSSDATPTVTPTLAPVTPAEDFISLKDFLVKGDGSLTERHTTSSTATPVLSTDGGETDKTDEQHDTQSTVVKPEETIVEASSELMMEELKSSDLKEDRGGITEEPAKMLSSKSTDENLHEDDDVASVEAQMNETWRQCGVSRRLLDLKDGNHDDEEHEEFVDDDERSRRMRKEKSHADEKESMNTSLGMKLDQHDDDTEYEDGALSNPLVDELFRTIPDVRHVIKDKPALMVLVKKTMMTRSRKFSRACRWSCSLSVTLLWLLVLCSPLRESQQGRSTEGEHCYRCGATGELAELDVAGGQRELYCQECWELFFFSEDRQSPMTRTSKTLAPSEAGRLTADEDALDEALKYSFHDSSVTREDMIHPWRYLQGSDSISSSIRDSNDSSITDRADEVWL
ncbi:hypothetical protein GQ600_10868 [Phytophthora cactorum]|nr:hypothetical protein GQ600_10868 [Phytophthora cactorum]